MNAINEWLHQDIKPRTAITTILIIILILTLTTTLMIMRIKPNTNPITPQTEIKA